MTAHYKEFTTTALRLANTWTGIELGRTCLDLENGTAYMIMATGAGAATMTRLAQPATTTNSIILPLHTWREVDSSGDVGNIVANGGVLASDTTPILRGDAAESFEIAWATGNADPISVSFALPHDFDGSRNVTLELTGYGGTTNAPSFTVETGWDGGALVSDTAAGTAAAGSQNFSATIAAADVPDAPRRLTIALTPGTHATDVFGLTAARLRYFPL